MGIGTDKQYAEIKTEQDLIPPGAAPGTVPTDLEQATGLERLEILGKMQGIDIFDMKPLDASRRGMGKIRPQFAPQLLKEMKEDNF
jgi:cytochrome c oxidase subunit 5b